MEGRLYWTCLAVFLSNVCLVFATTLWALIYLDLLVAGGKLPLLKHQSVVSDPLQQHGDQLIILLPTQLQLLNTHTHTHTSSQHLDLHLETHSGGWRRDAATSSLRSLCRKCWATWAGRMLSRRHSLCSRSSLMSSTSFLACSRHRKSSRAVASNCRRRRLRRLVSFA